MMDEGADGADADTTDVEEALLNFALEKLEREDAGLPPAYDPKYICRVCELPWDKHPRSDDSVQCSVCSHWTHVGICFQDDNTTCRLCVPK